MGAWVLGCFHSHISTQTFRRVLTASVDSCVEIKSALSVALPNLVEFGGKCRKAMLGVCVCVCVCRGGGGIMRYAASFFTACILYYILLQLFSITQGNVLVTINRATTILETDDHFFIPKGE